MKLCFPEDVLKQHVVVLGKTGAGKSSALRHIVEHLLRHKKRVCIIDIKGDWWGLKSSADGKHPGFPIVAFGSFREPKATDVPINRQSGKHVAELIAGGNRPCIVGFRGWMPAEVTEFWIGQEPLWNGFAPTLFSANEGELYVVISECHNFAPKGKVLDPKAGRVLHWTNRLLSEGRGLGMTFLLDSQRPQKVHNDTLTCCETLVGMRVVHKADRDAIEDWIKGCGDPKVGTEVLNGLAGLARGEAWVWSPEIGFGPKRLQFPMFETFDSFAPAQLQKKVSQSGWSEVDLDQVKQKLAAVIEEAKANDPSELRKQVRELKAQLRAQPKAAQPAKAGKIERVDREKLRAAASAIAALRKALEDAMKIIAKIVATGFEDKAIKKEDVEKALQVAAQQIVKLAELKVAARVKEFDGLRRQTASALERMRRLLAADSIDLTVAVTHNEPFTVAPPAAPPSAVKHHAQFAKLTGSQNGEITRPQQNILRALAEWGALGREQITRTMVAFRADCSPKSSAYDNNLGRLRSLGLIDYAPGQLVLLTAAGQAQAPAIDSPASVEEMFAGVVNLVSGPQAKIVEALRAVYPESLSREELAECAGCSAVSSAYDNNLGRLRSLGVLEYLPGKRVKCADWLFLEE